MHYNITIPKSLYSTKISFTYKCSYSDLVESLKFQIQDLTGIPPEWICLSSYGNILSDNLSLIDLGVSKTSIITVTINPL